MLCKGERKITWSPSEGTSPVPTRRSKALTPPELGSSKNSAAADFEGVVTVKPNVVEIKAVDKTSLLVRLDDDEVAEVMLGRTERTVEWSGGREHRSAAEYWSIIIILIFKSR